MAGVHFACGKVIVKGDPDSHSKMISWKVQDKSAGFAGFTPDSVEMNQSREITSGNTDASGDLRGLRGLLSIPTREETVPP